mmetsp:Transcript_157949/g.278850  ORF Transcript_157949/g.278850 Transcript_157949/m.278850 type:complete len:224 (-) Transcript_157949:118-789(-)
MAKAQPRFNQPWADHVEWRKHLTREEECRRTWNHDYLTSSLPKPGEEVELCGLRRRPELNGVRGKVLSSGVDEDGFIILRVPKDSAPMAPGASMSSDITPFGTSTDFESRGSAMGSTIGSVMDLDGTSRSWRRMKVHNCRLQPLKTMKGSMSSPELLPPLATLSDRLNFTLGSAVDDRYSTVTGTSMATSVAPTGTRSRVSSKPKRRVLTERELSKWEPTATR